jgi:hypothetical protein
VKSYPFITEKYTDAIVDLNLVKQWLEMDIDGYEGRDDLIEACIKSAIASVETECNFQLGISTYNWFTLSTPYKFNDTAYVKEIVSIKVGGTLIDSSFYGLIRTSERSSVIIWNQVPTVAGIYEVVFKAGLDTVDPGLLQAVRARITEHYKREDSVAEKRTLSDKLLAPFIIPYAG